MSSLFSDRDSQGDLDLPHRSLTLSDLAVQKLTAKLKLFNDSDTLTLADCFIGDNGCKALEKFVKEHSGITSVDLRGNNIGGEGLRAVAGMLRPPTSVVSLSLEWNNGHLGLEALADALSTNTTLRSLDLRNNKIGAEGAAQLARSLSSNKTLQRLDLRWNDLGQEGLKPFISLLESRQSGLQQLELSGNKAPEDSLKLIESLLKGEKLDESLPRRRMADTYNSHGRNKSSGTYRKREVDVPLLTHTRLETQVADLEFALEQERKRNLDLAAAIANADSYRSESESKFSALQDAMEQLQISFEEERKDLESTLFEERRQKEELSKEITRLQEMYSRQQLMAQGQVTDVESRLVDLQKALNRAEDDLSAALSYKERHQTESLSSLKDEFEAKIRSKDTEIASLIGIREELSSENRVLKGQLVQTQEQCKQSLTSLELQLREDETRRYNATFHSLDQKMKTVQDLREGALAKSQDLQRELMKSEKKTVEQALAFESERTKLQDQVRELTAQVRGLQGELRECVNANENLKVAGGKLEGENEDLRRMMEQQSAGFQETLAQMMTDQRSEREQWEQQRSSTMHRIQVLESELLLLQSEKRRALDEYVTVTQSSLSTDLKFHISKAVSEAVKSHLAGLEAS